MNQGHLSSAPRLSLRVKDPLALQQSLLLQHVLPGPAHYLFSDDWICKKKRGSNWAKSDKVINPVYISPGPGAYKLNESKRKRQSSGFMSKVVRLAPIAQTVCHWYTESSPKITGTLNFNKQTGRTIKTTNKTLGPGSYNPKVVRKGTQIYTLKSKSERFKSRPAQVPGPGHYQQVNENFKKPAERKQFKTVFCRGSSLTEHI